MHDKSVLILAYNFPPEKSGGVGRPDSLYKHLQKFGLEPFVVTIEHNGCPSAEINIFRFSSLMREKHEGIINRKLFYRIANKVLKFFGSDPLIDVYWSHQVKAEIGNIINNNNIRAIYASFPPIQSMKLGLYISKKYNVPLISEFRDGYLFAPLYKHTKIQKFFAKRLEREIINCSSAVITIGENLTSYFVDNYKSVEAYTVYNGFEKSDYSIAGHAAALKSEVKRVHKFVHFGSLNVSKKRNVQPLFQALSKLKQDGIISDNNFNLTLIGKYTPEEHNYSKIYFIEDIVKYKKPVEKAAGFIDIKDNYDCLLFYGVEKDPTFISAKLMEYIMLGKPILGICEGNEAENIIRMTKTGIICGFSDQEIYKAFEKFLLNELVYCPDTEIINQFDRERQAQQIAEIISKITN